MGDQLAAREGLGRLVGAERADRDLGGLQGCQDLQQHVGAAAKPLKAVDQQQTEGVLAGVGEQAPQGRALLDLGVAGDIPVEVGAHVHKAAWLLVDPGGERAPSSCQSGQDGRIAGRDAVIGGDAISHDNSFPAEIHIGFPANWMGVSDLLFRSSSMFLSSEGR